MTRRTFADWSAQLRAASDDDVMRVRAMEELGVAERTAYRWAQHGGPCQPLGPGILALHNGTPTRRQQEIAALLHGGEGAMLTGMSAGRHHGLRRGPDPELVHVLVPAHRQVRSVGIVLIERTTRLPRPLERDGLPVAPLVRAVLDQARRMREDAAISALLAEPVQQRRALPWALHEELDAGCRKGTAAPRRVIAAILDGVRSAAEFEVREWWLAQPELPRARFNVRVLDERGRLVGIVDILVEEVGYALEVDSVQEHFATPDQVSMTTARHRELREVGLHVDGFRPTRRRDDPAGLVRDILHGLMVAAALPLPRVTYEDDLPRAA